MVKHGFNSNKLRFCEIKPRFNKIKQSLTMVKPRFNGKYQIKLEKLLNQRLILD